MPLFKTTRCTLCVNIVARLEIVVFLINLLFNKRADLWNKDLVECDSSNKPSSLVVCRTKVT